MPCAKEERKSRTLKLDAFLRQVENAPNTELIWERGCAGVRIIEQGFQLC